MAPFLGPLPAHWHGWARLTVFFSLARVKKGHAEIERTKGASRWGERQLGMTPNLRDPPAMRYTEPTFVCRLED